MNPASTIGVAPAIQQLLSCIFRYGQGVRESKREINQLRSELLGLKAVLDHNQLIIQPNGPEVPMEHVHSVLPSSTFANPEFDEMLSFTNDIVKQLMN